MERAELILYATPCGALAEQCEEYFRRAAALGATTAQTYPPHCTLTGFFRRPEGEVGRVIDEVASALDAAGLAVDGRLIAEEVRVGSPEVLDDWLGLVLDSPRLVAIAEQFVSRHVADATRGDDPIRLKSWLHLSLAYGERIAGGGRPAGPLRRLHPYVELAERLFTTPVASGWEIALWRRVGGSGWRRLTPA
jgi:ubiquitin-associated SH3 domain-containing protein